MLILCSRAIIGGKLNRRDWFMTLFHFLSFCSQRTRAALRPKATQFNSVRLQFLFSLLCYITFLSSSCHCTIYAPYSSLLVSNRLYSFSTFFFYIFLITPGNTHSLYFRRIIVIITLFSFKAFNVRYYEFQVIFLHLEKKKRDLIRRYRPGTRIPYVIHTVLSHICYFVFSVSTYLSLECWSFSLRNYLHIHRERKRKRAHEVARPLNKRDARKHVQCRIYCVYY